MSDKTTVVSAPHAKAAKPGPWCNTTPTLLQRAKHRRHSLGGADELLAPRSVADETTRAAAVVSKDTTPTAAKGEDVGVSASDLSPPKPPVEYYRWGYQLPDGSDVLFNTDGSFDCIVTPDPFDMAIHRWKCEQFLPPMAIEPPNSTPLGREYIKTMSDAIEKLKDTQIARAERRRRGEEADEQTNERTNE
jgi:hypothetical protein